MATNDSFDLGWVDGKTLRRDDVTKKVDLCIPKLTFFYCGEQLISTKHEQDFSYVNEMVCKVHTKDEYVVEINNDELMS